MCFNHFKDTNSTELCDSPFRTNFADLSDPKTNKLLGCPRRSVFVMR